MKTLVRVSVTTTRDVNLYRYIIENGENIRTDEILETRKVEKETVLFSGSDNAFKIWTRKNDIPTNANVERISKPDFTLRPVGQKYQPQESFAQDGLWLGNP
jgi:hypothetical protein